MDCQSFGRQSPKTNGGKAGRRHPTTFTFVMGSQRPCNLFLQPCLKRVAKCWLPGRITLRTWLIHKCTGLKPLSISCIVRTVGNRISLTLNGRWTTMYACSSSSIPTIHVERFAAPTMLMLSCQSLASIQIASSWPMRSTMVWISQVNMFRWQVVAKTFPLSPLTVFPRSTTHLAGALATWPFTILLSV